MIKRILLIVLLISSSASAATYTVKPSGGDYTTPALCANDAPASMSADHICEVYSGTYDGWTQLDDGSNGHWIIVRKATGESPSVSSVINLTSRQHIEISNLQIASISTALPADNPVKAGDIKILNNTINQSGGTGSAIRMYGDDILISGNTFQNIGEDCIRQGGERWVIRDNVINNGFLFVTGHSDFWQSFGSLGNAAYTLLENNTMVDADNPDAHFSLANSTTAPVTNQIVRYNKISNVDGGYAIWLDDNVQDPGTGFNSSYHNTIVGIRPPAGANTGAITYSGSDNSSVINNIFSDAMRDDQASIGVYFGSATGGYQGYNLYYDPQEVLTFGGGASGEIGAVKNSSPLLSGFSIPLDSPAKDLGGPLTVAVGSGSISTSLVVSNASFFQAGWAGQVGDTVYVRTVARPDILVDFEDGSNGASVTTTNLNNSTYGSGGSWTEASNRTTVTTATNKQTDNPTYIGGTWYDDSTGTRSISYDDNTTSETFNKFVFSSGHNSLSAGMFVKFGNFDLNYTFHDFLVFWGFSTGTVGVIAQIWTYQNTEEYNLEVVSSGGTIRAYASSDRTMPDLQNGKWYWMSLLKSGTTAQVIVYDPDTWIPVTPIPSITAGLDDFAVEQLWIGNDPHNQASATTHEFDNLMISTSGQWPLFPTGAVKTARISSIDYATNTITLDTAISWSDGDEVGLYADSDGTVVYSGVAPDIGAYEYGAAVNASPRGTVPLGDMR